MLRILSPRLFLYIFVQLSFSGACSPTIQQTAAISPTPNILQSVQARLSQTPTQTPPSATATSTPTITPTFDVASAITATQSPPEECPESNANVIPDFERLPKFSGYDSSREKWLTDYFNAGGLAENLFGTKGDDGYFVWFDTADLTNDNVPEIILGSAEGPGRIYVFTCKNEEYQMVLLDNSAYCGARVFDVLDMNLSGIKELILWEYTCTFGGCIAITIYEYDGDKLMPLILNEVEYSWGIDVYPFAEQFGYTISGKDRIELLDVDGDGTVELILRGGTPTIPCEVYIWSARRDEILTYKWNGENFVLFDVDYSPPQYRFQAVQDGDHYSEQGDYEKALLLYQDAIFSDKLRDWSPEHRAQASQQYQTAFCTRPTPTLQPANPDTYYQVSAYARFRIMLLRLLENRETEAEMVYNNLIELIPSDSADYPYVEMATVFWQSFLRDKDIKAACDEVVLFAENNPEILEPLGGSIHDSPNRTRYEPEDVCPF